MTKYEGETYIYLASPYTHPDLAVMDERVGEAMRATAWLVYRKIWTFSPVLHCHEMAVKYGLARDFNFWCEYNFAMLRGAGGFFILGIDGWKESKGVTAEHRYARERKLACHLIRFNGDRAVELSNVPD